jgi:3-methyladenine DNA glycosylase AlkD
MKLIEPLVVQFTSAKNADLATGMAKYMKNHFDFLGLPSPLRRQLQKPFIAKWKKEQNPSDYVFQLWELKEREFQYTGMDLLAASKRMWKPGDDVWIEHLLTHKQWWDTIDMLSVLLGEFFLKYPENKRKVIKRYINSNDFWLNRVAILHQLRYASKTDTGLLVTAIQAHTHQKEFFIQKAIGWALRQYARTDAQWVLNFVNKNPQLSSLSKREALKHIG